MTNETRTPIEGVLAGISGVRIRDGSPPVIEFKVGIVLTSRSAGFLEYLASCLQIGASVSVKRASDTLEEALILNDDAFEGWPRACGATTHTYGMNSKCDAGHVTTTPSGEPCNYMEPVAGEGPPDGPATKDAE